MHFIAILSGLETTYFYVEFADTAHFAWVADAWQAVFVPNQVFFVGLLTAFELALWLFGGVQLAWTLVVLPFICCSREPSIESKPRRKPPEPRPTGAWSVLPRDQ